ncbi:outer membrane protein assembly factor BamB [Paludibacterium yongneupense]|uniref:outer membrane protein assembly factor BamB n=1 Tax=Paludibacterium yongneupense TaxID=400061 RepID=UPI0003FBD507|nr:outer membrane protein assembly factor BamB [Paludibacterium yongneupense]
MRRRLLLTVVLSTSLLAGCASWFESSTRQAATPLKPVHELQAMKVKWSVSVGQTPSDSFVPVYDRGNVIATSAAGVVLTIDSLTGRVVSKSDTGRMLSASVTVNDDLMFAVTRDGHLLAIDRASGKTRWDQALTSVALEPAQAGSKVVIVRSSDGRVTGFALADGKQLWSQTHVLPALTVRDTGSMALVGSDVALIGQAAGKVSVLGQDAGNIAWEAAVSTPKGATELERITDVVSRPVFDNGQICAVAYQGRVACFDAHNGQLQWGREISSSRGIALDAQHVYVTDENGSILSYDRNTGRNVWKQDDIKYRNVSGPAMLGRYILVTDSAGYAHLLSNENGSLVGRIRLGTSGQTGQPVSLGDSALIQGLDGRLVMLSLG